MSSDLSVIEDGEFMVAQVEGLSDSGSFFVDAYSPPHEYTVVDSGRIIVPQEHLWRLLATAAKQGLVVVRTGA